MDTKEDDHASGEPFQKRYECDRYAGAGRRDAERLRRYRSVSIAIGCRADSARCREHTWRSALINAGSKGDAERLSIIDSMSGASERESS